MRAVQRLTGRRPTALQAIRHGHNNVVTRVTLGRGTILLAKFYYHHPSDTRDRLGAEFSMLSFLAARGVTTVPRPIAADPDLHLALYSFEPGRPLVPGDITRTDVDALATLLRTLWQLRRHPDAHSLPAAADACFRLRDYADHLHARLARALTVAPDASPLDPAVARLLRRQMQPALAAAEATLMQHAHHHGLDPVRPLPRSRRTLSPADHGFHNALRRPDGSLVFLDFEYAGWDDPAQMIATTCLRPTLPVPTSWRAHYLRSLLHDFGDAPALANRIQLVYPMLMLKWAMILLNEFLPVGRERRRFARRLTAADLAGRLTLVRRRLAALHRALREPDAFMRAAQTAGGG